MQRFRSRAAALISMLLTLTLLSIPALAEEHSTVTRAENPGAIRMASEIVVRPVLLVGTLIGTAIFVVTLPFSALGGNVGEAADTLVVGPFKTTFMRCLGCTNVDGVEPHRGAMSSSVSVSR